MLLSQLREGTRGLHVRLEASVDLMSPALTRARYTALLKRFYGFYAPVERMLQGRQAWGDLGLAAEQRTKVPSMRADLSAVGLDQSEIDSIPLCPSDALPPFESFEDLLGCMYVVEGATLGGQIISRHLNARFGMDKSSGCAFFESYGQEVGPMWKSFVAALTSYPATPDQSERIVGAARCTFQSFQGWLESESA